MGLRSSAIDLVDHTKARLSGKWYFSKLSSMDAPNTVIWIRPAFL